MYGRIIYVASSTTSFPVPGMAVYGGNKTTPRYLVDILSKEIGHKGISCPMGRLAEVEDVANAAEFFASDLSSFVNGQHLLINGGATN
jgi:3-oxoacyl-[acyl-carrier protein] reductase